MVKPSLGLSVSRQCTLLGLARSSFYYRCYRDDNRDNSCDAIVSRLRALNKSHPTNGVNRMVYALDKEGITAGRYLVRRLMRENNIKASFTRPLRSSARNRNDKVYPYLLRNRVINQPNDTWAMDITHIPCGRGYVYLAGIIDWHSRFLVGWSLSNTMTAQQCVETVEDAAKIHGRPAVLNTDQGSQFTSDTFVSYIASQGIQLSMDGVGRWLDNVIIERFWRTLKYECVYVYDYPCMSELRCGIAEWIKDYNTDRPHRSLGMQPPARVYQKLASHSVLGLSPEQNAILLKPTQISVQTD